MAPESPAGVVVRTAVGADDTALLALDRIGWTPGSGFPSAEHGRGTESRTESRTERFFSERRRPQSFLVAVHAGRIVGYAAVRAKQPFAEAAHVQAVWSLVVDPGVRRKGVASALLGAAEDLARSRGARKLSLHVLGSNTAALALYAGRGYVVEGRHRGEFLIGGVYVDDIALAKVL